MFVIVADDGGVVRASVEDAMNLRQLRVEFHGVTDEQAGEALRVAGLGSVDEDSAWLIADALRAAGDGSSGWTADFYGMLAYAKTRGWTNEDGSQVRAHIVRS
jgi:hypothetical protein